MSEVINGFQALWPNPFGLHETPTWVMPWVPPGPVAREALACLDCPLRACQTGTYFDVADFYEDEPARKLKAVERAIRDVGPRLEWRLERVWGIDEESSREEFGEYEKAAKQVAGYSINPRCLDDYASRAWELAELAGLDDEDPDNKFVIRADNAEVFSEALDWAQAGVVVLQQSLPWPFTGALPYAVTDNRPAHRVLYVYASLLKARSTRQAKPSFRAMLYMNPVDNMGVRFSL
jgi:hypothetical protein